MSDLQGLIATSAKLLQVPDTLNPAAVLHGLAEVESGHGARGMAAKHETSYCYGGFYYRAPGGEDLRNLSRVYGCLAHCSYSSWQILFIACYELGFRGDPTELRNDATALPLVIKFLNNRVLSRYPRITLEGLADAWNSGDPTDTNVPTAYINLFVSAYNKWVELLK